MSEYDKHVERRARVIYQKWKCRPNFKDWEELEEDVREIYRRIARATMESDREDGMALVPAEATEEMLGATAVKLSMKEALSDAIRAGNVLKGDGE